MARGKSTKSGRGKKEDHAQEMMDEDQQFIQDAEGDL